MEKMTIRVKQESNWQSIFIAGELVYGNTEEAKLLIEKQYERTNGYIFDLTGMTAVDSTGFGVIVNFCKKVGHSFQNKKVVIILRDPMIYELFTFAKLQLLIPIVDSEAEAVGILAANTLIDE